MSLFSPVRPIFTLFVWGLAGFFLAGSATMSPLLLLLGVVLAIYLVVRRQESAGGIGALLLGAGSGVLLLSLWAAKDFVPGFAWLGLTFAVAGAAWLAALQLKRRP